MTPGTAKKTFAIIFSCVELCLLSGVMYGWLFYLDVLKEEETFPNTCNTTTSNETTAPPSGAQNLSPNVEGPNKKRTSRSVDGDYSTQSVNTDASFSALLTSQDGWYGILPYWADCEELWQTYVYVYVCAIFGSPILLLFMGILYDFCGTWIVRIAAIISIITGNLLIAYGEDDLSELLYGGGILVQTGGLIILFTNIQLSNFFFAHRSLIISVFIGCHFASSGIYLAIKWICKSYHAPPKYVFFVVGGLSLVPILTTFFFHHILRIQECDLGLDLYRPREPSHIKMNSKKIYRQTIRNGTLPWDDDKSHLDDGKSVTSNVSTGTSMYIERESYCKVTCAVGFILHVFWFSVLQLQFWFINVMRFDIKKNNKILDYREEITNYGQICVVILAPVVGLGMDAMRKRTGRKYDDYEIIHLKASIVPVCVTSILAAILAGIVFVPEYTETAEALYAVDLLLLIVRYFSWATMAAVVFQINPQIFFGRLFTVTVLIANIIAACHYPLLILRKWLSEDDAVYIFIGLAALVILTFVHPIHMGVRVALLEREHEKRLVGMWSTDSATYTTLEQARRGTGTASTSMSDMTLDKSPGDDCTQF